MKIFNHKNLVVLVLALGCWVQSCEDYLAEELVSDVSASSYYTTVSGFEDAVKATYSFTKPFYGVERGFTMTAFGTDTYTNGSDGGHKGFNFYDGRLNATNGFVRDTWRDFYRGINQANAVINRSESLEGLDEELRNARLAEVRFLRGLYYFNLVRFYGDVHLSLEETQGVEIEANRREQAMVYSSAIIPDLEFAIANLPDEQDDYGRATKPAAEFLLAKAHMTRHYTSFAESNDAARAEALMTSVIENYNFSLLDDFESLWDIDNEQNSEVVFAIQNAKGQVDEGLDGQGHRGHLYFLMEYDRLPGMTRDIENGRPWKRFRPTDFLLGLWDRSIDARYDKSFRHVWLSNTENGIPVWSAEEAGRGLGVEGEPKFEVGDTAVFIPGPQLEAEWPQSRQAEAPYLVITSDEYTERLYPTLKKWLDNTRPNRQHVQGQRDYILMRLADAYLIRAEARLAQNDADGAASDVNVIRRRGAVMGEEAAMVVSPDVVDLDFILDERARELVGEGHRWFDLTRTNKLVERVRLHNEEGGPNIEEFQTVRPIPQNQLDRTLGSYAQNPGYQ